MKAAGMIVEYNPFHNGHLYHLEQTRAKTNADIIIAVMSGNFLQRGEPAMLPKFERTKMALAAGVDIIVELPYAFSTQKAETFANGSISLLDALKVQEICFGSENGNIDDFLNVLQEKDKHHAPLQLVIKEQMKLGLSYPRAVANAQQSISTKEVDLSLPNNILGLHYIEAIKKYQSAIIPKTIQRHGANYHDETFTSTIASATSIRKTLLANDVNTKMIEDVIPAGTSHLLHQYLTTYNTVHHWELYFPFLKYALLTKTNKELSHIYEAEEGLENRLLSYIGESTTFLEFMEKIKTKRYTWTRLQRLCLHILTNTTKEEMRMVPANQKVPYARLLGMNQQGQKYLSSIKKDLSIPLVTNVKSFSHPLLQLDQKASAVYTSIFPEPLRSRLLKQELVSHPIRYNNT